MKSVFEISRIVGGVPFHIGFAFNLKIQREFLLPIEPFSKGILYVPGGWLECRGDWHGPRHLPVEEIVVKPVPMEIWMLIPMVDAIHAIDLCSTCSVDLGRDGYTRIPYP